jgi:hypothetical protein
MSAAGRSGTGDFYPGQTPGDQFAQETAGEQGMDLPSEALLGELGEPVAEVEVITVEMGSLPPAGATPDMTGFMQKQRTGWFRWWYVPAALVPAAVGAATAVLIARRRQQPAILSTVNTLASGARRQWKDLTGRRATTRARRRFRRGVRSAKYSASGLTDKAKAATVLAGANMGTLASRTSDSVRDALDDANDAVRDALDRVRDTWMRNMATTGARKRQGMTARAGEQLTGLWYGTRARFVRAPARQTPAKRKAQASRLTALTAPVTGFVQSTGERTSSALSTAGQTVSVTGRRLRAFGFGVIVSAVATYFGLWQRRWNAQTTRETASGRQVRGYWPRFGGQQRQPTGTRR